MELRCGSQILHGIVDEDGLLEVACRSKWCGKRPGVVVLHKFNTQSGELISTQRFTEPQQDQPTKEESNGTRQQGTSVRSA